MATIFDVADKAGVSIGTVSRVLNDSPLVSDKTRQRVLDVIDELDYRPSPMARGLSTGKTTTISVIVPYFTAPSTVERLRGIVHRLSQSRYDIVLFSVETVEQRDANIRDMARRERGAGVLIVSLSPTDAEVERFEKSGVPLILVDAEHDRVGRVVIDDVQGGRLAAGHLVEMGHRRVAYLGDEEEGPFGFSSSRNRRLGYEAVLQEAGIDRRPDYIVAGPHARDEARGLATGLLSLPDRPTAIFAASDTQAVGTLQAAADLDLRVPEDVSVMGFDDIELSEFLGLSTIHQPLFESGERGAELLLAEVGGSPNGAVRELLDLRVMARATTAPPA